MQRSCKSCSALKPIDEFPPYSAGGKRGRRGVCRTCWNAKWSPVVAVHQRRYYHENRGGLRDRVQTRSRIAFNADGGHEIRYRHVAAYEARHPEKAEARRLLQREVRAGRIQRQPCEVCSEAKTDAHHDDYSKPLDVRWLCRTHHGERHRLLNRRLLDGREWNEMPQPAAGQASR